MQIEALRRSTRVEQTPWNVGLTLKVELCGGMIGTEAYNAGRSFGNAGLGEIISHPDAKLHPRCLRGA